MPSRSQRHLREIQGYDSSGQSNGGSSGGGVNPPGPFNTSIIEPFADGWMVVSAPGLVISGGADAAFFEVRDIDYQGETVTAGLFKGSANIDDPQDANRDNVYEVSFVYDGGGPDDFGVLIVRPKDMHLSYPDTATNTPPITFQTGQDQNDTDPHTPDPDYLAGAGADCYFFTTVDFAVPQDANGDNVYEAYFFRRPGREMHPRLFHDHRRLTRRPPWDARRDT